VKIKIGKVTGTVKVDRAPTEVLKKKDLGGTTDAPEITTVASAKPLGMPMPLVAQASPLKGGGSAVARRRTGIQGLEIRTRTEDPAERKRLEAIGTRAAQLASAELAATDNWAVLDEVVVSDTIGEGDVEAEARKLAHRILETARARLGG
jgi:hypothetical protein